jgi:hypothetical protein
MTNIFVIAQLDWAIQFCFFLDAGSPDMRQATSPA